MGEGAVRAHRNNRVSSDAVWFPPSLTIADEILLDRYMFPLATRTRMAEFFGDPSCVRWWLPDDRGFKPILSSIRDLADERNAAALSTRMGHLREVRHVFAGMQLGAGDEDSQTGSGPDGGSGPSVRHKGKGKGVR